MKVHSILSMVFLLLAAIPASSQTKWFKYVGNPVISCGPDGAWDDNSVYPNRVIFQDTIYRMWYTGGDGVHPRTGLATSRDGVHWTKSAQNPVLDLGPGLWEQGAVYEGYVLPVDTGYMMWYTGADASGNWKLGYAFSYDGIVWTKATNPIFGAGPWYTQGSHNPCVFGPDSLGHFKMWFQGNTLNHVDAQIGYATATNETTWTVKQDPAFPKGPPGSWDDDKVMHPKTLFNGGRYEMWYGGENDDGLTEIGYAIATNETTWTRYSSPVMGRGPLELDLADLYSLDVLFDGSTYHMWYGGRRPSPAPTILPIRDVGYAVSPKGMSYSFTPVNPTPDWTAGTMRITVRVDDPTGLGFSAKIKVKSTGAAVDTVQLFDDGTHGDTLATDGVFSNTWAFPDSNTYSVDLVLTLNDTLRFEMNSMIDLVTSVQQEALLGPQEFSLGQNYPNPFNPSTKIGFKVQASGFTSLKVFDLLGREVATLVNEELKPGSYEATWEAAGFPSGVYFYRLETNGSAETKKLVLAR